MLVFKNNIYDTTSPGKLILCPDLDYNYFFDPLHFVKVALNQEEEVLSFIERQAREYWREDFRQFYPHSGKINSLKALKEILRILKSGLNDNSCWQQMNTFHFCFLHDVLVRFSFNYNHDNLREKLSSLPELKGKPIYLGVFFSNYFFNKAFLVDPDFFNSLERGDKVKLGYDESHLFAVINGLTPTLEEMALKKSQNYPYTVFV